MRRRFVARGITREPYALGDLVRVRVRGCEVTCIEAELPSIVAWALAGDVDAPLPVPEFTCVAWEGSYRWTSAADEVYRARRAAA